MLPTDAVRGSPFAGTKACSAPRSFSAAGSRGHPASHRALCPCWVCLYAALAWAETHCPCTPFTPQLPESCHSKLPLHLSPTMNAARVPHIMQKLRRWRMQCLPSAAPRELSDALVIERFLPDRSPHMTSVRHHVLRTMLVRPPCAVQLGHQVSLWDYASRENCTESPAG